MPIRHIVILNFKENMGVDYIQLMESMRILVEDIAGVKKYSIYENESKYVPNNIVSVGVQIDFEDDAALDSFMKEPKHYQANTMFEDYLADPPFAVLTHHV